MNSLIYAGDQGLDAANMSFFADPWLFNCRNNADQRAIVQAISRATSYAQQRGVVLVAAAGNEGIDLSHPTTDEISPDYPPGAAVPRPVNNSCVVHRPSCRASWSSSATGAENLLAGTRPTGTTRRDRAGRLAVPDADVRHGERGRVLAPYSSTAGDLAVEEALGRLSGTRPRAR